MQSLRTLLSLSPEYHFSFHQKMQSLRTKVLHRLISRKATQCREFSTALIYDVGQPTPASHPELLKEGEITPGISTDEYRSRRNKLLELLPEKSIAILGASTIKMMNFVVPYPFRQDADYLYITGCTQPGGVAVLGHDIGLCMFLPERDLTGVRWEGNLAGVNDALEFFKANQAYPMSKIDKMLPSLIRGSSTIYHNASACNDRYVDMESFQTACNEGKVKDVAAYTHELRLVKSPAELNLMKQSASIGSQALLQTMLHSKIYPHEAMIAAKVEYECKMRGAQIMAFNPVVGGGPNGSVIHYSRNDRKVNNGELVLMDIGCELHGYVSDMTRTWPPYGRFSSAHAELYNLILETNKECVELCKPGATIQEIHEHSTRKMYAGLREIGVLKDKSSSHRIYHELNPTSIGHYLGMDVHDCARIKYNRTLQPGIVITIEPGVYIPSSFDGPERYRGVGIRIEDEVLITDTGHEVLTASVPKEVNHIESLLNNHCPQTEQDSHSIRTAA